MHGSMMYTLRQVTVADYAFLFHLHRASMKDYVSQTWDWDERVQQTLFQERFEPSLLQIVVVDGRDVGVLSIKQQSDTLVLANLQILPDSQKQGLGTAIIRALIWQASQQGISVSLQVLKVNPALKLYERLGFTVTGETDTHYLMKTVPGDREIFT
jgi:ribosomal protein S18 acetylase RimI-like enzyme